MNNKNSTIKILLPVIATIAIIWYIFDGLAILNYWYALVSIFIDIYSYKSFNIADAIFDTGITCIPVWLLSQTDYWLYVLIILLVNFIVVLTVNFNFRFSIKSEKNKNTDNKSE